MHRYLVISLELLDAFFISVAKVVIPEEQLEIGKQILETFTKYLLVPGLEFDFNLNAKVVATGQDIEITLETPSPAEILRAVEEEEEAERIRNGGGTGDEMVLSMSNLKKLNSTTTSPASAAAGAGAGGGASASDPRSPPSTTTSEHPSSSHNIKQRRSSSNSKRRHLHKRHVCAVFVHAELFVMDIFEDSMAAVESLKQAFAQDANNSSGNN